MAKRRDVVSFVEHEDDGCKTRFWECRKTNREKTYVGNVQWNFGRRRYCFFPVLSFLDLVSASFAEEELGEIANFLRTINGMVHFSLDKKVRKK